MRQRLNIGKIGASGKGYAEIMGCRSDGHWIEEYNSPFGPSIEEADHGGVDVLSYGLRCDNYLKLSIRSQRPDHFVEQ
jgi:hypothetical protein